MGRTPAGETRERIFKFMRERLLAGRPPTVREVQQAFGFKAVQTAREHLETLVAEGFLTKEKGKARGYRLRSTSRREKIPILVPILGRIQAGNFDLAVENLEGYVPIQSRRSSDELFGLEVRGESMRDAGILAGDVVVVRRQATANSGDIVVALVGEEATVKRLRLRKNRLELLPENPAFKPIVPDPREVSILGKVIELRRFLDRPPSKYS